MRKLYSLTIQTWESIRRVHSLHPPLHTAHCHSLGHSTQNIFRRGTFTPELCPLPILRRRLTKPTPFSSPPLVVDHHLPARPGRPPWCTQEQGRLYGLGYVIIQSSYIYIYVAVTEDWLGRSQDDLAMRQTTLQYLSLVAAPPSQPLHSFTLTLSFPFSRKTPVIKPFIIIIIYALQVSHHTLHCHHHRINLL